MYFEKLRDMACFKISIDGTPLMSWAYIYKYVYYRIDNISS